MHWFKITVLLGMLGLACKAMARHIFEVNETERQSHKALVRDLESKLPKHNKVAYAQSVAHEVANLLAKTRDKYQPGAVLGKFSVNELLDLNQFDLSRCTKAEHKRRAEMCRKLEGNANLHTYCADCLTFFENNCALNRELVFRRASKDFKPFYLRIVTAFAEEVLKEVKEKELGERFAVAVRLVQQRMTNQIGRTQVVFGCREFNRAMGDLYGADHGVDKRYNTGGVSLIMIHECCKEVVAQLGHSQRQNTSKL
jgi:hypothetical protein